MPDFFIQTFKGHRFFFDKIEENVIDPDDLAHALALNCRFTGHVRHFYSVAQHCFYASYLVPDHLALAGLLHDAAEAYVHDTPSPLKWWLKQQGFQTFSELEKRVERAIEHAFGLELSEEDHAAIKEVDMRLFATEHRDLMPPRPIEGWEGARDRPYDWHVVQWSPRMAETQWAARFFYLTGGKYDRD